MVAKPHRMLPQHYGSDLAAGCSTAWECFGLEPFSRARKARDVGVAVFIITKMHQKCNKGLKEKRQSWGLDWEIGAEVLGDPTSLFPPGQHQVRSIPGTETL